MKDQETINKQIRIAEKELADLDAKRTALQDRIRQLKGLKQSIADEQLPFDQSSKSNVTNDSTQQEKIALFRSLFRGREDVYPRRFESKRSGKSGYQLVCRKEWIRPFCQKPKIKCGNCENRNFTPLSDDVIRKHLIGNDPADRYRREFVIGFPTFDKPRIVHCSEDFPKHIGLPRGCFEDTTELLHSLGIQTRIVDERFGGDRVKAKFTGILRPEQLLAAEAHHHSCRLPDLHLSCAPISHLNQ